MYSRSRKRPISDSTAGQTEAPKAKRKRKPGKASSQSSDHSSSPNSLLLAKSPLAKSRPLHTPSRRSPKPLSPASPPTQAESPAKHPSVPVRSKASSKGKQSQGSRTASRSDSLTDVSGHSDEVLVSSVGVSKRASSKTLKSKKKNHLKPLNGSWMNHIASILVYRCVGQALARSVDPRGKLKEFRWDILTDGLLTSEDLKMVWFFIEREYVDTPLKDISETLKPFSKLTIEPFLREEIKEKYKDQVPKAPLSAYMLFCKAKGPKLKEKQPDLTQPQMAQKLGKKWKSMSADQQDKYKQQYLKLRKEYDVKLKQFYEEHPDAKPSTYKYKRRTDTNEVYLTPEERRLKMLKSTCPRPPLSAYMLFCKAKREKVHRKHPKMKSRDVTVKLSKKWKSMGEEDKIKYKRMHLESSKLYKQQLKEFHDKYPDAKALLARKRKRGGEKSSEKLAAEASAERDSLDSDSSSDESEESPDDTKKYSAEDDSSEESSSDEEVSGDHYRDAHNLKSKVTPMLSKEEEVNEVNDDRSKPTANSRTKFKDGTVRGKKSVSASSSTKSVRQKQGKLPVRVSPGLMGFSHPPVRNSSSSGEDTDLSDIDFM